MLASWIEQVFGFLLFCLGLFAQAPYIPTQRPQDIRFNTQGTVQIHLFDKPSNKWPQAPVTNLKDQIAKEKLKILKMEPTATWAENQRVGLIAKTFSR